MDSVRGSQELSPHNIIAHPALSLPRHDESIEEAEATATASPPEAKPKNCDVSQSCGEVTSPEISSPACDARDSGLSRQATDNGFSNAEESKDIRLDDGRVCGWKSAVFIMAQMDRLAEVFVFPEYHPNDFNCDTKRTKQRGGDITDGGGGGNGQPSQTYCVDVSPDTFELLASIISLITEGEQFDGVHGGNEFRTYMLIAAIRLLKVNLSGLLRDNISAWVIVSMASGTIAPFDIDDANQFELESCFGQDSARRSTLPAMYAPSPKSSREQAQTPRNVHTEQLAGEQGQGLEDQKVRHKENVSAVVGRYRDVLLVLRRRLLLIVHSGPPWNHELVDGKPIQREAATALILGLELFFSTQDEKFRFLSELLNNTGIEIDDADELPAGTGPHDCNRPFCGPHALRYFMLDPLLQRLCDDALASKLVPYGADVDNQSSLCTVIETLVLAVKDNRVITESARLLEIHVSSKKLRLFPFVFSWWTFATIKFCKIAAAQ